jgi:putative heme iron utilization protein
MTVASAHLNGGFARAADLAARDVLTDVSDAQELMAAEEGAVQHMNADHAEATRLYATRLLGLEDGAWRISGLDPDGADLMAGDRTARLAFPQRVTSAGALRQVLVELAKLAREQPRG